jgi:lysophospholipase L1-like esterase
MSRTATILTTLAIVVGTLGLHACSDSSGPDSRDAAIFARFVTMGNSLAAGFESGGIDLTTQSHAWPVLVAAQTGTSFVVPTLNASGCPAPFTGPLGPRASSTPCAGRVNAAITEVHNVAVPGERIADALATTSGSLHTLLIGSRTQVQAMRDRNPTFVAVELGNNDALDAALSGVATSPALTDPASFASSVNQLVTQLKAVTGLRGVAILSVLDPTVAPLLQPGAYYFLSRDAATGKYKGKLVNSNCSPLTSLGQPNPLAMNLLSEFAALAAPTQIDCDPAVGTPGVLSTAEITTIRNAVTQYNASLQAAATANGWAFVDVNAVVQTLMAAKDTNGRYTMIRKCQDLAAATTPAQFQAALANSCAVTGSTGAPNLFGLAISFDGVHPTELGAREIARAVIARVNAVYSTTIPALTP